MAFSRAIASVSTAGAEAGRDARRRASAAARSLARIIAGVSSFSLSSISVSAFGWGLGSCSLVVEGSDWPSNSDLGPSTGVLGSWEGVGGVVHAVTGSRGDLREGSGGCVELPMGEDLAAGREELWERGVHVNGIGVIGAVDSGVGLVGGAVMVLISGGGCRVGGVKAEVPVG